MGMHIACTNCEATATSLATRSVPRTEAHRQREAKIVVESVVAERDYGHLIE